VEEISGENTGLVAASPLPVSRYQPFNCGMEKNKECYRLWVDTGFGTARIFGDKFYAFIISDFDF
jgi:hypothetical protein